MTEPTPGNAENPVEEALRSALSGAEQALSAEQPPVADWAGLVRSRIAVRRRHRQAAGAGAGALLVVAAAAGVLYAVPVADPESLVAVTPSTSASPTPSAESDPAPVAEPSVAASPEPSAEAPLQAPAATSEPSAAPVPSPAPEPAPVRQQPPPAAPQPSYPPSGTQDIEITAQVSNDRPLAGEEITVDVEASGRAETPPSLQGPQIDDEPYPYTASSCTDRPAGQSPPPARPQSTRMTVRHTFDTPGRHTLTFRADSACSYYQGFDELVVVVEVQPAP